MWALNSPMKTTRLLPFLSADAEAQVQESALTYHGYAPLVSEALGALVFGQLYGWRAVMMLHNRSKIKSFEQALGVSFRECMPDRTDVSDRILGVKLADELGKFWAIVKGEVSVPGGKAFLDHDDQADMFRTG